MNIKNRIFKNFLIYFLGSILRRGISAILAPLYIKILTPADYGLYGLVVSFIYIFTIIIGVGLRQIFGIEYFHLSKEKKHLLVNDVIFSYLIISLPIIIILFFNLPLINKFIFFDNGNNILISIILIYCFFLFFSEFFIQVLMYQCQAVFLTKLQLISTLINMFCTFFFLLFLKLGIPGIILAQLISTLYMATMGLSQYIKKTCFLYINIKETKEKIFFYVKMGLPFVPGMLFSWILSSADKWILAKYSNLTEVGIYSVADTIGQLYNTLILHPLAGAYIPYITSKLANNKDAKQEIDRKNKRLMYISMLIASTTISVGYLPFKYILLRIAPYKYHEAIQYIWLILMGYIFLMGTYFTTIYIRFLKKTYFLAVSLFVPALLNIGLNILLIPAFGTYGCVSATFLSYVIYFFMTLLYNSYLHNN